MPTERTVDVLFADLDRDGIVVLPRLVSDESLAAMQRAFAAVLSRQRWNDFDGYEKTEPYRHMVQNVLTLEQGYVDVAIHPTVKALAQRYVGPGFELVEAKGWKSLPTTQDFHGWHGDAWYDQTATTDIPRELKIGFYLTDVRSGAFNYIAGTHRLQAPRPVRNHEAEVYPTDRIIECLGPAGSAFLFDTSGIHRQSVPILEERRAMFYNFHDPAIKLQHEDVEYYRYHPLLLNAAFLGGLSAEDGRILGFGNKTNYVPAYTRRPRHELLQRVFQTMYDTTLAADRFKNRVAARARRTLGG